MNENFVGCPFVGGGVPNRVIIIDWLNSWAKYVGEFLDQDVVPYWMDERSNVSILAGSIRHMKIKPLAIGEPIIYFSGQNKKVPDLLLLTGGEAWYLEAKVFWPDKNTDYIQEAASNIEAARNQLRELADIDWGELSSHLPKPNLSVALCFVGPYFNDEKYSKDESFQSCRDIRDKLRQEFAEPDNIFHYFEADAKDHPIHSSSSKYPGYYPGIAIVGKVQKESIE